MPITRGWQRKLDQEQSLQQEVATLQQQERVLRHKGNNPQALLVLQRQISDLNKQLADFQFGPRERR